MREIWIPELISVFFLFLFLFRPFIKGLWPLEGLNWFPFLALAITLGLFPAYGFRPECIPLLLYSAVLTMLNMPSLTAANSGYSDDFHNRRTIFILPAVLFLALASAVALFFAPLDSTEITEVPRIVTIRDERQNRSYTLHIFGLAEGPVPDAPALTANSARGMDGDAAGALSGHGRPLLLVVPPEAGGFRAVDSLCAALGNRGFTVICYSRRGFDSFAPAKLLRMWQSFRKGTVTKKANDFGRALESGRREDLDFLLPYIRRNAAGLVPGADREKLFLAGCGAGGSALVYLTADPAFIAQNRQLRGIVTLESGFWSSYKTEERRTLPVPATANWFKKVQIAVQNWFAGLRPLKIAGMETVPQPGVPALYLMSDRSLDAKIRAKRYGAAFQILQNSSSPAAFAALNGAGPLDYFDYPEEYPLYSALFSGLRKTSLRGPEFIEKTAGIITNFAASLLKAAAPKEAVQGEWMAVPEGTGAFLPESVGLRSQNPEADFHIETRSWNLPDLGYIIAP
jgi:hypothetical protein